MGRSIFSESLRERRSFVTETVFSHESKLELIHRAQAQGFRVLLYHIHVSTPELAIARVQTRVSQGGHDVPTPKVHARYPRTLNLLMKAVETANRAFVFDNSRLDKGLTHVMTVRDGRIERLSPYVPDWVKKAFAEKLRNYLQRLRQSGCRASTVKGEAVLDDER